MAAPLTKEQVIANEAQAAGTADQNFTPDAGFGNLIPPTPIYPPRASQADVRAIDNQILGIQSRGFQAQVRAVDNEIISTQTQSTVTVDSNSTPSTTTEVTPDSTTASTASAATMAASVTAPKNIIEYVPSPNLLYDYPSYTYCLSLHAIPPSEYNDMIKAKKTTGAVYNAHNVLISSAGRFNDYDFVRNPEFSDDFYFDNLRMDTIIGLNSRTRMTNAIHLEFSIIEPYGMTLLQRLIVMAQKITPPVPNYLKMAYMLQIDFYGYDENGKPIKIDNTTKWIPIQILSMKIKISTKGAEYQITAIPYNHQAFTETVGTTPAIFEVTARTVDDFFADSEIVDRSSSSAFLEKTTAAQQLQQNARAESEAKEKINKSNIREPDKAVQIDQVAKQYQKLNAPLEEVVNKSVNTNSYTAAFNAWLDVLAQIGKVKYSDRIKFKINPKIGKSVITPPVVQPHNKVPMAPTDGSTTVAANTSSSGSSVSANTSGGSTRKAGTTITPGSAILANIIASKESGSKGYDAYNRGTAGKFDVDIPLSNMRISDVMALQATPASASNHILAAGRYQIIGPTMKLIVSGMRLDTSQKFSPDIQDQMFQWLLQNKVRSTAWNYITGKSDDIKGANDALAREWAAIGLPDTGESAYAQIAGNKASITPNQIQAALKEARLANGGKLPAGVPSVPSSTATPSAQGTQTLVVPNAKTTSGIYQINQGTPVIDVISQVIRNSDYIRSQIKSSFYGQATPETIVNQKGLVNNDVALNWFKITSEIELGEFDEKRNEFAKTITYIIEPMIVYNTQIAEAPLGKPLGVVKVYDYIFTGQNKDILNFDIDYNALYYTAKTAFADNPSATSPPVQVEPMDTKKGEETVAQNQVPAPASNLSTNTSYRYLAPNAQQLADMRQDVKSVQISDLLSSLLNRMGGDMIQLSLKIVGDPDFIKQDDLFYGSADVDNDDTSIKSEHKLNNGTGSLIMDKGELHVQVNFKTATDYNSDGLAIPSDGPYSVSSFSGIYRLIQVSNSFQRGKFEQDLILIRIFNQATPGIDNSLIKDDDDGNVARDLQVSTEPKPIDVTQTASVRALAKTSEQDKVPSTPGVSITGTAAGVISTQPQTDPNQTLKASINSNKETASPAATPSTSTQASTLTPAADPAAPQGQTAGLRAATLQLQAAQADYNNTLAEYNAFKAQNPTDTVAIERYRLLISFKYDAVEKAQREIEFLQQTGG